MYIYFKTMYSSQYEFNIYQIYPFLIQIKTKENQLEILELKTQ